MTPGLVLGFRRKSRVTFLRALLPFCRILIGRQGWFFTGKIRYRARLSPDDKQEATINSDRVEAVFSVAS
jgi:hypothetical protein